MNSTIELIMIAGFMIPVSFGLFFIYQYFCVYWYELVSTVLGWPYL